MDKDIGAQKEDERSVTTKRDATICERDQAVAEKAQVGGELDNTIKKHRKPATKGKQPAKGKGKRTKVSSPRQT